MFRKQATRCLTHDLCFHLQSDVMSNFHVGEVVTSLQKSTLIPGGSESLVYTTLSGSIGILVPFTSHEVSGQGSEVTTLRNIYTFNVVCTVDMKKN